MLPLVWEAPPLVQVAELLLVGLQVVRVAKLLRVAPVLVRVVQPPLVWIVEPPSEAPPLVEVAGPPLACLECFAATLAARAPLPSPANASRPD